MKKYFLYILILFIFQSVRLYAEDNSNLNNRYFINEQNLKIKKFLHNKEIKAAAISSNGKIAAAVINDLVPNRHFIDFIRFVNLDETDSEIPDIIPEGKDGMTQIHHLEFSPNGQYLAFEDITSGYVSMFQIWDIYKNKKIFEIKPTHIKKYSFKFLKDNSHIMISYGNYMSKGLPPDSEAGYINTARIWNYLNSTEEKIIKPTESYSPFMRDFKISPDGRYFVSSCFGFSKIVLIWDIEKGEIYKEFSIEDMKREGWLEAFTFSNDGNILLFATDIFPQTGRSIGKRIRLWDIKKDKIISSFDIEDTFNISIMTLSKDGKKLIMSGEGIIHVYDIDKQKTILKITPIIPGQPPACFNAEKELIAFGTSYESHLNKTLRYLLICDLKEGYGNN